MLSVLTPPPIAPENFRGASEESLRLSDPSKGLSHLPIATDIP